MLQRVRASRSAGAELTAAAAIAAALPFQGSLSTDSPLRLLYLAAAATANGLLTLESESGKFELHVRRGAVEHAATADRDDGLASLLVARGIVALDALAEAERVRGSFGGDLVSALASLQLLNPAHTYAVLQEHGVSVVSRAIASRKGACRWDPAAVPPPSSFPLGSRWGIPCDAVRRLEPATVRQLLGDREGRVATRSGGRVDLSQLKLTAREARVAALFDGRSSALQLAAARPAEGDTIFAVTLLLGETELLAFGAPAAIPPAAPQSRSEPVARIAPVRPSTPAIPARPPSAPPSGAPPSSRDQPDAAALEAFHAKLTSGDHFEVLGLKRDATPAQVKAAYFALAKRFHPDAGVPGEAPALKKMRADIFARLGEAWRVLGNDRARAEYLVQLESGGTAEIDVSGIFKAEELFRNATLHVKARQYDAALAALREATALNPDEPEFAVWTAWVKFLLAEDRSRQHATSAEAIEGALKAVPRCMPGYLFLAQMAKIMGDLPLAERHLNRGLALDPDAIDLVRELKYLRK